MNRLFLLLSILVIFCVTAFLVILSQTSTAEANTIFVDDDASPGGDGTSWALAFDDLQDALDDVVHVGTPCEIWVAAGTYNPSVEHGGSGERYKSFQMINNVGIYGGFSGTETTRNQRDWETNKTVLCGDIGIQGYQLDNCYHVLYHPSGLDLNETAVLDGFTVTGGYATGDSYHGHGGGMLNWESSPSIINCGFSYNSAKETGGGIFNVISSPTLTNCIFSGNCSDHGGAISNDSNASPTIIDCIFTDNSVEYHGGGIYNINSSPKLIECEFIDNDASIGGGIHNRYSASPDLKNCTFTGNSADDYGGGMYTYESSSPTLTDCSFYGNSANSGGGIYMYSSSPDLISCTFSGNSAWRGGGFYVSDFSLPTLTGCVVTENTADYQGGGFYCEQSSSPIIINSILCFNVAEQNGGGMYNYSGCLPAVTNCTFWNNSSSQGGALYNSEYSSPLVTNSILWGSTPNELYSIDGSSPVVTYSDVEGGYPGKGNIDQLPMLANPDFDNFHLLINSPCIDTGTNSAPFLPAQDYEGDPRIIDEIVDMGVDESLKGGTPVYYLTVDVDPPLSGTVDLTPSGGVYDEGTIVALLASPFVGNEFDYWSGDLDENENTGMLQMDGHKTVTAHFTEIPLPLPVIYVDAAAGPAGDGTSWASAFDDLQEALDEVINVGTPCEIWVVAGTYTPSVEHGGTGDRYMSFQMINDVGIYGGFAGTETERNQRDSEANRTVLSGDIRIPGYPLDDCYHVFYHPNELGLNETAILDGFTITKGNADGNKHGHDGAGMYNYQASVTLVNCIFKSNNAGGNGAGICNEHSSPNLTNCKFIENDTNGQGGGISNSYSSPTLTDCLFSDNSASNGGGIYYDNTHSSPVSILTNCILVSNVAGSNGGGICNLNSSLMLIDCDFTGNSANNQKGGGIYNSHVSSMIINDCTFASNTASRYGGGIHNDNSSPTLTNCGFTGNSAIKYDGGGLCNFDNSSPILNNCAFSGNTSGYSGGGIYNNEYSSPEMYYCTLIGNSAGNNGGGIYSQDYSSPELICCIVMENAAGHDGGGIYNEFNNDPIFVNSVVAHNTAGEKGGGMYSHSGCLPVITNCTFFNNSAIFGGVLYNSYYSNPTVTNSILWGNMALESLEIENENNSSPIITYSDIKGGYPGIGNISGTPMLTGDFHLIPTSPCIDAGTNSAPEMAAEDYEGDPRIINGRADMGADETGPFQLVIDPPEGAICTEVTLSGYNLYLVPGSETILTSDVTIGDDLLATAYEVAAAQTDLDGDGDADDFQLGCSIPITVDSGLLEIACQNLADPENSWAKTSFEVAEKTVVVTPGFGVAGTEVKIQGTGWCPGMVDGSVIIMYGNTTEGGTITSSPVVVGSQCSFSVEGQIPDDAAPGEHGIVVFFNPDNPGVYEPGYPNQISAHGIFVVAEFNLTVVPNNIPFGTVVTMSGGDFGPEAEDLIPSLYVNGQLQEISFGELNSAGNIVPLNVPITEGFNFHYGENIVEVRVEIGGQMKSAMTIFNVVRPNFEIDPASGPRGTTVVTTGGGWLKNSTILIDVCCINGDPIEPYVITGANEEGELSAQFQIPIFEIGKDEIDLQFTAQDNYGNQSLERTFTVKVPTITVEPDEAHAGQDITVSGYNFMPKSQVQEISIGDAPICPVYDLGLTSGTGSFIVRGTVPGVLEGEQAVKVRVTQYEGSEITTPFTVLEGLPEVQATRNLPDYVSPGSPCKVQLSISGCGMTGQVSETLPAGFTYLYIEEPVRYQVNLAGQNVEISFKGDAAEITYYTEAPLVEGEYVFSGVATGDDASPGMVSGDETIFVETWNCLLHDTNLNDRIDYPEMVTALMDYLTEDIAYFKMVDVLMCYLTG